MANVTVCALILVSVLFVGFIYYQNGTKSVEKFEQPQLETVTRSPASNVEQPREQTRQQTQRLSVEDETNCKKPLVAADLLPKDADSTLWASVNPKGKGTLEDKNFLAAGYHIGVNTVGQSLRNANLNLRSEPANPQKIVSPWNQSTIEPDSNRRDLLIGSAGGGKIDNVKPYDGFV